MVLGTFLLACGRGKLTPAGSVVDVSPSEAVELVKAGKVFVLDVRTMEEYKEGHITPSLIAPYQDVSERRKEISSLAHGLPVLVYCHSGHRSSIAAKKLAELGFKVYNLEGGKEALLKYLDEHPEHKDVWCTKPCPGICGYKRQKEGCGCR